MDSLDTILTDLAATLDVDLQEGRSTVELSPDVVAAFLGQGTPSADRPQSVLVSRNATSSSPVTTPAASISAKSSHTATEDAPAIAASLQKITGLISACTRCELHATRTQAVPGVGRLNPDILFIGEAPGAEEDAQGIPFVGRAGQLLTRMIVAMGYTRDEIFIANILKCRPPNNRPPTPKEMEVCLPFLRQQIALIHPRVIVALGTTAVQGLLNSTAKISQLRNRWHAFEGIPLMPTFHPSYLLRFPAAKRDVWADLQAVLKYLGRTPPPRPATPPPAP